MYQYNPGGFFARMPCHKEHHHLKRVYAHPDHHQPGVYDGAFCVVLSHVKVFRPWQIITHMFMHGNFTHLLFNMYALWMFGSVLEQLWGPKKFLLFFFVTGLGAAAIHMGVQWISISSLARTIQENGPAAVNALARYRAMVNVPTVGASGAVYGILLGYGMLFPNTELRIILTPSPEAKYFVIIFAVIELVLEAIGGGNVALRPPGRYDFRVFLDPPLEKEKQNVLLTTYRYEIQSGYIQTHTDAAAEVLRGGGAILYPTDTIWGLGCDACNPKGVKNYGPETQGRTQTLHRPGSRFSDVVPVCGIRTDIAEELVQVSDKPLTLIYPKGINLAPGVMAEDGSVAIRIPNYDFCQSLIRRLKRPLLSTSANVSGAAAPALYQDIDKALLQQVDWAAPSFLEAGSTGKPSSIIRVGKHNEVEIIRP